MADTTKRHPIRVVARRTGTPETTLRAWERRYGAVRPERADTGRRLYSDDDVARLLLIRRAIDAGRSVSSVAGMTDDDLLRLIQEDAASGIGLQGPAATQDRNTNLVAASIEAVSRMDDAGLRSHLSRASLKLPTIILIDEVITPLLQAIDALRRADRMGLRHERMASSVIRMLLTQLQSRIHSFGADTLVSAMPSGQIQDISTHYIAALAASEGWHVVSLGADIPAPDIALAVNEVNASVLVLGLTDPNKHIQVEGALTFLTDHLDDRVLLVAVGRALDEYTHLLDPTRCVEIHSAREFSDVLQRTGLRLN